MFLNFVEGNNIKGKGYTCMFPHVHTRQVQAGQWSDYSGRRLRSTNVPTFVTLWSHVRGRN